MTEDEWNAGLVDRLKEACNVTALRAEQCRDVAKMLAVAAAAARKLSWRYEDPEGTDPGDMVMPDLMFARENGREDDVRRQVENVESLAVMLYGFAGVWDAESEKQAARIAYEARVTGD